MRIEPATLDDIITVAASMRAADYAELSALSWSESRGALLEELAVQWARRDLVAVHHGGEAVAVGGLFENRPRVITLGLVATPRFTEIAIPLTRYVKQRMIRPAISAGAHRVEAITLSTHLASQRWLMALGLAPRSVLERYGKGGEDFIMFAWVRS